MATLPLARYYRFLFLPGLLIYLVPTLLRTYLLSPFPGSQEMDAIDTAYFVEKILVPAQILGAIMMLGSIVNAFLNGSRPKRTAMVFLCVFLVGVFLLTRFQINAERMFEEPKEKRFATVAENKVPLDNLVIGVIQEGEAKAYPVQYIGYHHKVQDSVGGRPVLVTYCTMCRTGRVYDPIVDGHGEKFRLVGAQWYNAMLEDEATGSWWYQATGEAAIGPSRGKKMQDIPYEQMTLRAWIERHPNTLVMQPDPNYVEAYKHLEVYDRAREMQVDSSTGKVMKWGEASWVVGVDLGGAAKAYEWNSLIESRVVNDDIGGTPVVVALESDTLTFHVWKRTVDGAALEFTLDSAGSGMRDKGTGSLWSWRGECVEGSMQGKRLDPVQAHQEFWHSWRRFHPKTGKWE